MCLHECIAYFHLWIYMYFLSVNYFHAIIIIYYAEATEHVVTINLTENIKKFKMVIGVTV